MLLLLLWFYCSVSMAASRIQVSSRVSSLSWAEIQSSCCVATILGFSDIFAWMVRPCSRTWRSSFMWVSKQKPLHNILLYSQQKKNSSSSSCDMTTEEWGKKNHTSASSSQLQNKTNSNKCYQNPESFTSHGRRTTKCTVISRETDYHIQVHIGLVEKTAELLHEIFYCTCCPIWCKPIATVFCRMFRSSGFHVYHYIEIERDACAKIQIDRASVR